MITPAISVMSAVEGLKVAAPSLGPFVIPLTGAILVGLFWFQHRGTGQVGMVFGPVTLVWFAVLGLGSIVSYPGYTPAALIHNLRHNKVIHEEVVVLTVVTEDTPRVPPKDRLEVEQLGNGFYRILARYGFMEDPHVPHVLRLAKDHGLEFALRETSFFLGREVILASHRSGMPAWRERLFQFLARNAQPARGIFHVPPDLVVEPGAQVQL